MMLIRAKKDSLQQFGVCSIRQASKRFQSDFTWSEPHPADRLSFDPAEVFRNGVRHHHRCNTAFPLNHNTTIKPYRVPRLREQKEMHQVLQNTFGLHKDMMLYVHVPFCHTRCQFCEYTVVNPKVGRTDEAQSVYFDALMDEFRLYDQVIDTKSKNLVGFDIGGGTPSMASIPEIERIMKAADKHFKLDTSKMEISIETTPKIAASEPEKINAYYQMGMRRISMGLQTTDFKLAKELGRDDANAGLDYVTRAVENIRNAGFKSFNIDLMYGFPVRANREDPWAQTVRDAIALGPEHITLYRMRYKGTSLEHLTDRVGLAQVNQQEGLARQILTENGYVGMIGKNTYSKMEGSSGCSDYLDKRVNKAVPYVGLGLGAQSFTHHTLSYNLGAVTKKLEQYVRSVELGRIPIQDLYHLSLRSAIAKMISVSFYYGGIDLYAFQECFKVPLTEIFPREIEFVLAKRLMQWEGNEDDKTRRLQLTSLGKQHFGGVVALFYSPSVQQHVINLPGGEQFPRDPLDVIDEKIRLGVVDSPSSYASSSSSTNSTTVNNNTPKRPIPVFDNNNNANGSELWAFNKTTNTWVQQKVASNGGQLSKEDGHVRAFSTVKEETNIIKNNVMKIDNKDSLKEKNDNNDSVYDKKSDSHYEFGNILFGGACNQRCPFCIGHQLDPELTPDNLRKWPLENVDQFIAKMKESNTRKLIFTGTRTDPQLYKYEGKLLALMREQLAGIHVSLHTNGMLATRKMDVLNQYDTVTISVNSFDPEIYQKMHGTKHMPDIQEILSNARIPVKLSCVLTEDNVNTVDQYLETAAKLGVKRLALRHLFNDTRQQRWPLFSSLKPTKIFCGNPVYTIHGMEVTHWIFENTTGKSLNLFSNGHISEEYMLAKAPGNVKSSSAKFRDL